MWLGDRLLFTCIPSLWELRDDDGDGQAEHKKCARQRLRRPRRLLRPRPARPRARAPTARFTSRSATAACTSKRRAARVVNPDSGAVLRCNPDGSDLELFATGLRNPQELAFNEYGNLFTGDNNSDGGDRARLVHIVEGRDSGWRMSYQYLADRGPFNREKIWHTQNAEQPASIVPPLAHSATARRGWSAIRARACPRSIEGAFFLCDFRGAPSGRAACAQFWVEPDGASYRLAKEAMFAEGVLATDCDFGPDGALYISDWVDGWGGTGKGRIHRVTPGDDASTEQRLATQDLLKRIAKSESAELLTLLGHADMRVRLAAQRQLVARGESSSSPLVLVASTSDANLLARLHAIWAIGELSESDPKLLDLLTNLCDDSEPEVRAEAAKTIGRGATADESLPRTHGARAGAVAGRCFATRPGVRSDLARQAGHRDALPAY